MTTLIHEVSSPAGTRSHDQFCASGNACGALVSAMCPAGARSVVQSGPESPFPHGEVWGLILMCSRVSELIYKAVDDEQYYDLL